MSSLIALALFASASQAPEPRVATVKVPTEDSVRDDAPARRWLIGDLEEDGETRDGLRVRLRGTRVKLKMPIG